MPATQFDKGVFPTLAQIQYIPHGAERQLVQVFAQALQRHTTVRLVDPDGDELVIPKSVFNFIREIATVLARGDALTLVPIGQHLTTQQAANLLNISCQYLIRLLDEGVIPFERTGSHRRLRVENVVTHRERHSQTRKAALGKLAALSQELGSYDEP